MVGGLATAAIYAGPTLWELTAPADRLGALVAEAERELAQRRAASVATGAGAPALTGASSPGSARAAASGSAAVDTARREPFARVGSRISVTEPTPAQAPSGEAAAGVEVEPAFTVDVVRGQTVYRMNGDLVLDPGQHPDEMVEAGYEYRFGKRGLEKVKLWEVRR
jgi:hypothetical protein